MGGASQSLGSFLGTGGGGNAVWAQNLGNAPLTALSQGQDVYNLEGGQGNLQAYGLGKTDVTGALQGAQQSGLSPQQQAQFMDALATGSTTGTRYATEQLGQYDPTYQALFGKGGAQGGGQFGQNLALQNQQTDILKNLQNQGYELQPQDQTLYGQAAGQIARNYGQQGNQAASDLAARGLSNSGAAGATFSGLAGNQNEQLAQAQQNIMQQRFANTQNQIAQQQGFINSLMGQNANLAGVGEQQLQNQYGRQLSGAQNRTNTLAQAAGAQTSGMNAQNVAQLNAAKFNAANQPQNFVDILAGSGPALAGYALQGGNQKDTSSTGSDMYGSNNQAGNSGNAKGQQAVGMASMFA